MKIGFWGLLAFDIAAMFVIARTASSALTMFLVMSLLVVNFLLAFVFTRSPSHQNKFIGHITTLLRWASWTDYIPVVGGMVCVIIGMFEIAWKPCVIGGVAISVGLWRIWSTGRVRQALQSRR
jgi:hypothetical protein